MKIYTEINYEWLDGQLVMTDSKSFDYDGEVTLCTGDGGGGEFGKLKDKATDIADDTGINTAIESGANLVDTGADIVSAAGDTATGVVDAGTDALSAAGDTVSTATSENLTDLNTVTSGLGDGLSQLSDNTLGKTSDLMTEAITTGSAAIGSESNRAANAMGTNLAQVGTGQGGTLGEMTDQLNKWGSGINTSLADGITGLTNLIPGMDPGGGGKDVDVSKFGGKKGIKSKSAAKLKVNKSKGRARKSLRIG